MSFYNYMQNFGQSYGFYGPSPSQLQSKQQKFLKNFYEVDPVYGGGGEDSGYLPTKLTLKGTGEDLPARGTGYSMAAKLLREGKGREHALAYNKDVAKAYDELKAMGDKAWDEEYGKLTGADPTSSNIMERGGGRRAFELFMEGMKPGGVLSDAAVNPLIARTQQGMTEARRTGQEEMGYQLAAAGVNPAMRARIAGSGAEEFTESVGEAVGTQAQGIKQQQYAGAQDVINLMNAEEDRVKALKLQKSMFDAQQAAAARAARRAGRASLISGGLNLLGGMMMGNPFAAMLGAQGAQGANAMFDMTSPNYQYPAFNSGGYNPFAGGYGGYSYNPYSGGGGQMFL
jgi:hypothetical protein